MATTRANWAAIAALLARLVFAAVFAMAAILKFSDPGATAHFIAAAGFPLASVLVWLAALFETALSVCLLTGLVFSEAAIAAAAYVLFLGFAFHGPAHWAGNQTEFGFFIDHFTFLAGLLFAACYGPGTLLILKRTR
jgi:putative oxidoreductase